MRTRHLAKRKLLCGVAVCAMAINALAPIANAAGESNTNDNNTTTPIKHVIVIIGENRTFDHLFATYQPVNGNETVLNLLLQKIINSDGTPGPNYTNATQYNAQNYTTYQIHPIQHLASADRQWRPAAIFNCRGGSNLRKRPADRLLSIFDDRYGPRLHRRPAGHSDLLQRQRRQPPAAGSVPADQQQQPQWSVSDRRRLRREPGASLLPDAAADRLQHRRRLPKRSVSMGRSHGRRGQQRQAALQ